MPSLADIEIHCSKIMTDRDFALTQKDQARYLVYLDTMHGYPQIKIIAPQPHDYVVLDDLLTQRSQEGDGVFAIHDNYSHYQIYDNETYTIPITKANFIFLREFLSNKEGFDELERYYLGLPQALKQKLKSTKIEDSTTLSDFNKIIQYSSWIIDEHLFAEYEDLELSHLDQLRGLQKKWFSDEVAIVFMTDENKLLLNDLLISELQQKFALEESSTEIIEAYHFRYEGESGFQLNRIQQKKAEEQLGAMEIIWLIGAKLQAGPTSIFFPYQTGVYQCQNEIYRIQINSETFKDRVALDPFLTGVMLPTQLELVELIAHGRWSNDSPDALVAVSM